MRELDVIADYGDLCGEGALWDTDADRLYWTDWVRQNFYVYDWLSQRSEIVKQGLEITSCAMNRPGGFMICNTSGVWLWDGRDKVQKIVGEVEGYECKMNDAVADPVGRLFAGTWFYDADRKYPLGHLVRVNTDGRASIVDEGIHLANGLGFSPDCRTLYLTDSVARCIYSYDYEVQTGKVGHRRVAVKVPDDEGIPDGMTVDAEGFIWSAQWYGSCVIRYDPDGKPESRIQTPAKQTASVALGGAELTDIFITTAAKPYLSPLMPPGYNPDSGYLGGRVYHANLGIQGKPEFKTNFAFTS